MEISDPVGGESGTVPIPYLPGDLLNWAVPMLREYISNSGSIFPLLFVFREYDSERKEGFDCQIRMDCLGTRLRAMWQRDHPAPTLFLILFQMSNSMCKQPRALFILLGTNIVLLFLSGCTDFTSCVAKGTKISTPDGFLLVEDVKPGDTLLSYDPKLGKVTHSVVKNVIKSKSSKFINLNGRLLVTTDHIIFNSKADNWVKIQELDKNSKILLYEDDVKERMVTSLLPLKGIRESFDIMLFGDVNNYFANGILVHNKSPMTPVCHASLREGFCRVSYCIEGEAQGYCGDTYKPLCHEYQNTGVYYESLLVVPNQRDTAEFCPPN